MLPRNTGRFCPIELFLIFILSESNSGGICLLVRRERTRNQPNKMTTIESHTNAAGDVYFSTTDEDGQTIYSFTEDFEDIWTQDDEDAIAAGSTPAKY